MVSVIAMSHFKDFMWVDGWSTTRERTVVKIPINEGQRNMTWTATGLYLPMTESVDWNCIPSALGRGSALSVSAGRLHFPLTGSWLMPLSVHPGVHPILSSWWWIHNFRERINSSSSGIPCNIIMQTTKSVCTSTVLQHFLLLLRSRKKFHYPSAVLFSSMQKYNHTYTSEWACLWSLHHFWWSAAASCCCCIAPGWRLWRCLGVFTYVNPEGWHIQTLVSIQPTTARINYHSGLWPCLVCCGPSTIWRLVAICMWHQVNLRYWVCFM